MEKNRNNLLDLSNISIFDDFLSKEESEESNEEEEERDLGTLKDNILSVMKSPQNPYSQYELIKTLGVGGDGKVFLAKHKEVEGLLVLKRKTCEDFATANEALGEALNMARLSSPYIVKFFDVFLTHETNDGTDLYYLYIAMEYCPEGDLLEFIQKEKERPFSLKRSQITRWIYQILRGLKIMHKSKTAHCDLKLENIFLVSPSKVKIGDFGVSKFIEGHTKEITGTTTYLAPEIFRKEPYNHKVDIWALGLIWFQLLSLQPLSWIKRCIGKEALEEDYDPHVVVKEIQKLFPEEAELIAKMLNKDPILRPPVEFLLLDPVFLRFGKRPANSLVEKGVSKELNSLHLPEFIKHMAMYYSKSDKLFKYVIPNDQERQEIAETYFSPKLCKYLLKKAKVWGIFDNEFHIDAVGIWFNPDQKFVTSIGEILKNAIESPFKLGITSFTKYVSALQKIQKSHDNICKNKPHWRILPPSPTFYEHSLANSMLQLLTNWADSDGICIFHTSYSEEDAAYLSKFGFEIKEEIHIGENELIVYALLREPERKSPHNSTFNLSSSPVSKISSKGKNLLTLISSTTTEL